MPIPVLLGTASTFAVLAGSGITTAGAVNSTKITGDIGTFPTLTETGMGNVVLSGINHVGDALTQQAKNDLVGAYNAVAGQVVTQTVATELGSTTLGPGVYNSAAGTFTITGTLTLDGQGNPNAVFIFQAGSTLITAAGSNVVLINGAQACNVFWQIGSSATLGTTSNLLGTVLALTFITATTGATVSGRLLARNGAVTMDTNTLAVCSLTGSSTGGGVVSGSSVPGELIAANPCLDCLSEHELKAIIAYALRFSTGLTLAQVVARSACYRCLSRKQMLVAFTAMITNQLVPGMTASQLRAAVKCTVCGSDKHLEADILYLFTNFYQTTAI
jgi:hypothetical protein